MFYQKIVWKRYTWHSYNVYLLWYTSLGERQFINCSENWFFLQKRVIRIINNASYNNHTDHLLKNCEIFKLSDMYQYQVCLSKDDFTSKRLSQSLDGLFRLNSDLQENRATRQSSHMNVPRCNYPLSCRYSIFPLYGTIRTVSFPLVIEDRKLRKL